jgi:hypothetical protein
MGVLSVWKQGVAERRGGVVKILLRIWEVPVSNLGPEAGYSDWVSCGFSQALRANAGIIPQNLATTAFFQIFPNSSFTYHLLLLITYHPIIRRCIVLVTEKSIVK